MEVTEIVKEMGCGVGQTIYVELRRGLSCPGGTGMCTLCTHVDMCHVLCMLILFSIMSEYMCTCQCMCVHLCVFMSMSISLLCIKYVIILA